MMNIDVGTLLIFNGELFEVLDIGAHEECYRMGKNINRKKETLYLLKSHVDGRSFAVSESALAKIKYVQLFS